KEILGELVRWSK
ncbi:hypothetical protein Zm00014a_026944, partial [Zea mays]